MNRTNHESIISRHDFNGSEVVPETIGIVGHPTAVAAAPVVPIAAMAAQDVWRGLSVGAVR